MSIMTSKDNDLHRYLAMLKREPMIPDMQAVVSKLDALKTHGANLTTKVDLLSKSSQEWNTEQKKHKSCTDILGGTEAKLKLISIDIERAKLQKERNHCEKQVHNLRDQLNEIKTKVKNSTRTFNTIIETYSKAFQFKVNVLSSDEDCYRCEIDFMFDGEYSGKGVFLRFDAEKKELIDFDAKLVCTKAEENKLREWYQETKNLPGLICKLRTKLRDGRPD